MILIIGINAKYIHSNFGIYCIDAYSKKRKINSDYIQVVEYTINHNEGDIIADIFERQPEVVAFSCYIWNIEYVIKISKEIHKIMPNTDIWFGGPEVSFDSAKCLEKYSWITGIIYGEGEVTFYELALYYQSGGKKELKGIKGLAYRDKFSDSIYINSERELMIMDDVVFPYVDFDVGLNGKSNEKLNKKDVVENSSKLNESFNDYRHLKYFNNRIVYYETSRGCPYGCSYCLSSVDKCVRFRSMELVEKELKFFLDAKVLQVKFVDRTFNCNHKHTMEIWKYIHNHDNGITNFHFELSADLLTDDEIEYIKNFRHGLVQFEIGVQTTNADTLRAIHRANNIMLLKKNIASIKKGHNIHLHLDLIAGLPYENYTSFKNSFNEVYAMEPDQLQLGFLKVLKGSPLYNERDCYGIVYQDMPPYEVLYTKWLSYSDIILLKRTENMVERYYNSMQFEASVRFMVSCFDTPFDFFQELGNFFHDKEYDKIQQSRVKNYEIILEFAKSGRCGKFLDMDFKKNINILTQMLVFDLYSRENMKKRPDFALAIDGPDKDFLNRFYKSADCMEKYLDKSYYVRYDWKQVMRMTHIEIFNYNIPFFIKTGQLQEEKVIMLFDYSNRSALNNQAQITRIDK